MAHLPKQIWPQNSEELAKILLILIFLYGPIFSEINQVHQKKKFIAVTTLSTKRTKDMTWVLHTRTPRQHLTIVTPEVTDCAILNLQKMPKKRKLPAAFTYDGRVQQTQNMIE